MQVVGYDTAAPALLVSGASPGGVGPVERVSLDAGDRLDYALGDRRCAGALRGDTHRACPDPEAPYCPDHASTWACARCTGDCDLPLDNCHEPHAVYLAAFAPDTFKVGVTKAGRLDRRLREQGADRAAHLRTVENGRRARRIEAGIAERVPDRVRVPTKRAGLAATVDEAAWADLLDEFDPVTTYDFEYGLALDDRPVAETLAAGRVRGTKGRLLVLDNGGSTYAVDLRDLVGHELREGGTDRDLQASLGAF